MFVLEKEVQDLLGGILDEVGILVSDLIVILSLRALNKNNNNLFEVSKSNSFKLIKPN